MKIVFIVPPEEYFIESYVTKKLDKGREFRQKLGILYVAGYLRDVGGITPTIIDCLAEGYDLKDLQRVIREIKPDLVGFSVLSFNLLDCLATARMVKESCKDARICFGGFHVTLYPLETLALPNVDYVVYGEGEATFAELAKLLAENKATDDQLRQVDGLVFKSAASGELVMNSPRKPIADLDSLPLPAHDLLDVNKYTFVLAENSKVGSIQTSRGCPSKCVFCDIRMTKYRYRSEESVIKEIKLLKKMGIDEFFIIDDTFTINRNRVIRLCNLLLKENLGVRYKISSRIDKIDAEMLDLLARSGCYRIHYGVESGSQRILDYLQKEITPDMVKNVFAMTKKAGIDVFAYMMIGIPTETYEDMQMSFDLVRRTLPDHVNYSICTPFPKTYLYEMNLNANALAEDYWHAFAKNPRPDFKIRTMNEYFDEKQLRELQDTALRHFYSSPRIILRELRKTKSFKQILTKARMGLRLLLPRK